MCGPLPGTKVHDGAVTGRIAVGACGRREARGAGVLTERSAAERASTRRPEESLSAWSQEPARTRGRPAPQRRSALTRTPQGRRLPGACDGPASNRGSKTRPRSAAQRSEGSGRNRQRVRNGIGNGVAQVTYIHIFHYPHTGASFPPDSVRGKDASVCGRARARGVSDSEGRCNSKTVRLFTE